jgi:hypothetical protein
MGHIGNDGKLLQLSGEWLSRKAIISCRDAAIVESVAKAKAEMKEYPLVKGQTMGHIITNCLNAKKPIARGTEPITRGTEPITHGMEPITRTIKPIALMPSLSLNQWSLLLVQWSLLFVLNKQLEGLSLACRAYHF